LVDDDVVAILEGLTVVDEDAFANTPARPYFGTAEDDDIEIGAYGDRVVGFSGDDNISFADGVEARDMTVQAGAGSDTVVLGDGDDFVEGRVVIILIGVAPSTLNASNVTINNTNVSS
jgi:Ca2+-binding RTX toxin-like protein